MKRRSKTTACVLKRRTFWIFISVIVLLIGLYGYFVSKSIVNVIIREEIEQDLAKVNAHISDLEYDYIKKKNTINLKLAYELGLRDVRNKKFITRGSLLGRQLTVSDEI
ncbi:hypothetical protein IID27_03430 [Patescibacteria group bacterium]|nr:hypothetical protein [Patescibacteria group bacterium]